MGLHRHENENLIPLSWRFIKQEKLKGRKWKKQDLHIWPEAILT